MASILKKDIHIAQGHFINTPSQIIVSSEAPDSIWVGGAIKFITSQLELERRIALVCPIISIIGTMFLGKGGLAFS